MLGQVSMVRCGVAAPSLHAHRATCRPHRIVLARVLRNRQTAKPDDYTDEVQVHVFRNGWTGTKAESSAVIGHNAVVGTFGCSMSALSCAGHLCSVCGHVVAVGPGCHYAPRGPDYQHRRSHHNSSDGTWYLRHSVQSAVSAVMRGPAALTLYSDLQTVLVYKVAIMLQGLLSLSALANKPLRQVAPNEHLRPIY